MYQILKITNFLYKNIFFNLQLVETLTILQQPFIIRALLKFINVVFHFAYRKHRLN